MWSAYSCRSTLPVYSQDKASIMLVYIGISWCRERKEKQNKDGIREEKKGEKKGMREEIWEEGGSEGYREVISLFLKTT